MSIIIFVRFGVAITSAKFDALPLITTANNVISLCLCDVRVPLLHSCWKQVITIVFAWMAPFLHHCTVPPHIQCHEFRDSPVVPANIFVTIVLQQTSDEEKCYWIACQIDAFRQNDDKLVYGKMVFCVSLSLSLTLARSFFPCILLFYWWNGI